MPEFSIESIDFDSPWVLLAIVVATVVHDDLTCLVVGSAVAAGEAAPVPVACACLAGTWTGDLAWFLSAHFVGPRLLAIWPFRLVVSEADLESGRARFARMGGRALFASRFLPVLRTPLQVASGLLTQRILPGCALLLLAGMIYVSLFISAAATVGQLDTVRQFYQQYGTVALVTVPIVIWGSMAVARLAWKRKSAQQPQDNDAA